jgi:acyl-CoA dehydrogenase
MIVWIWILLGIVLLSTLAYTRVSLKIWIIGLTIYLLIISRFNHTHWLTLSILWALFIIIFTPLAMVPLRRRWISKPILNIFRQQMPTLSHTEREALEAGTVGWDGELFSGKPNWQIFQSYAMPNLSAEEQAFLEGPVANLCSMIDDWDITHNRADMPSELWQYIREQGFWGMIIPKKYGGKEFSALAHSAVVMKIASVSVTVATTVQVPNSLGPAELLLHYGTEQQKDYYLPRLAKGEEIPCFALTGPEAGSDAGAMTDNGIICHGLFEGKEILGMCLNWNKRYITLAPVATVLGLAFKLYDPEHLLSEKTDLGITCALIPVHTAGITIGRRHYPLNCAFQNGPTQGKDVFVPLDWIIGGLKMAGQGWRMLMECLATGRALSLPSTVTGGAKAAVYASGAYARIRKQFGLPIARFEGIEEVLARIGGFAYITEAVRVMTVAAVARGEKPAVLSAISKYETTELSRCIGNDAMDIHGGKGICLGPHNYLGRSYQELPIGITVEGANILTRNMIIFGQGAIRCHPCILAEISAAKDPDEKRGLLTFDRVLFQHLGFIISNKARAFCLGLTQGYLAKTPGGLHKRYYQHLTRLSAAFAFMADISMLCLGANLKRRERLSARLADVLSMLYLASAVLKYFAYQGQHAEDSPFVAWSCEYLFYTVQQQLDGLLRNFPYRWVAAMCRWVIFPLGKRFAPPSDGLGRQIAYLLSSPSGSRQRLSAGIYTSPSAHNPLGKLGEVLEKVIAVEEMEKRLEKAKKSGQVVGVTLEERIRSGVVAQVLTTAEAVQLLDAEAARASVIAVDDFAPEDLGRVTLRGES